MIEKLAGPDTRIKWISIEDIGAVAAKAFGEPGAFVGKSIPLAGDEKSIAVAREVFRKVDGKAPFQFSMPTWLFRRMISNDLVEMWLWFKRGTFDASIDDTREILPGLMNIETWLEKKPRGK